jgi:hypothetical protein
LTNLISVLVSAALAAGVPPGARSAVRTQTPSQGVRMTPEAERSLRRIVLGLEPNQTKLLMVPETAAWDPKTKDPRVRWLRRQVYRLNFELGHGQIFRHSPPYTRFFVAVPDPRTTPESLGNEETVLREHLRERVGWSDHVIDERVRFFSVPAPVPFPQDIAEPIGYDEKGRLVLAIGSDADDWYHQAVQRLVAAFPEEFVVRRLPGINTEGGDLALVRLREGGVGLLVGHNRVARFARWRHPESVPGAPIPDAQIEEARGAYQQAFDGIETIVVGPEALRNPGLANPEIFHLDMLVAVLRTPSGVVAFVPTYQGIPIDAITHVHVSAEAVRRFQAEYDRTARQLSARGYRVARVPFADHPARNPVGIGKFVDAETGRPWVILGRYPDHLADSDDRNAQTQLQLAFEALDAAVAVWRHDPTEPRWSAVRSAVEAAWRQMDASVAAPNPVFESQRKVYESYGIGVMALPIYPTGEGGVHCLVLK